MVQKKVTTQLKTSKTTEQRANYLPKKLNRTQRVTETNRLLGQNKTPAKRSIRNFKTAKPAKKVTNRYPLKNKITKRAIRKQKGYILDYNALTKLVNKKTVLEKRRQPVQKKQKLILKRSPSGEKFYKKPSSETSLKVVNINGLVNCSIPVYTAVTNDPLSNLLRQIVRMTQNQAYTLTRSKL
jgi:hypothetical protein